MQMHHKELEYLDKLKNIKPGGILRYKKEDKHHLENAMDTLDKVNNPSHYNRKNIEAIAAIEASMSDEEFKGYIKGNVLKYVWRYSYKGGLEDLQKAKWYLDKLIEVVNEQI